MSVAKLLSMSVLVVILVFTGISCGSSSNNTEETSRQIALDFVKNEATYQFDGMEDTLEVTLSTQIEGGWEFTIEYNSLHAGYGDRTGQMVAQVITHHIAVVTIQDKTVKEAVMDGVWDMLKQQMMGVEISLAPIHEVDIVFMESFPVQVGVHIQLGLRDGCTTFHDAVVTREGNTINIEVTTQHPKDAICPAVYTYYEKNLNLGSDFTPGTTYTVQVNDVTRTFTMP